MKFRAYEIVTRAIEEGIPYGINRYYKYREEERVKDENALVKEIYESVVNSLCEVLDFENDE